MSCWPGLAGSLARELLQRLLGNLLFNMYPDYLDGVSLVPSYFECGTILRDVVHRLHPFENPKIARQQPIEEPPPPNDTRSVDVFVVQKTRVPGQDA
jgi:hypothetical protein